MMPGRATPSETSDEKACNFAKTVAGNASGFLINFNEYNMASLNDEKKICRICKVNEVYEIKSHLTPAGITENTYGKRNEELIYTIDAQKRSVEKYYGPNYPQTEDQSVKLAPNSRKGIFCKVCEDNLVHYESAVQKKLNEVINAVGKGIAIQRTAAGNKFVDIPVHPNVLTTYFQSVIWRQCLEQEMDGKDNVLSVEKMEALRKSVLQNISVPVKEMERKAVITDPRLSIITGYHTTVTASYANPNTAYTNPGLFFI